MVVGGLDVFTTNRLVMCDRFWVTCSFPSSRWKSGKVVGVMAGAQLEALRLLLEIWEVISVIIQRHLVVRGSNAAV